MNKMIGRLLFGLCLTIALASNGAFGSDGQVLVNQSTVMASGGFPYTISQPGSYKLSGNLVAPAGVNGIRVAASNVTLDLNGFTLSGPPDPCDGFGCVPTFGITAASVTGTTIRNGTISGFSLPLVLSLATQIVSEDLVVNGAGGTAGAAFFGTSSIIHRLNTSGGVVVGCPAVVTESVAVNFTRTGDVTTCSFGVVSGPVN